MRFLRCGKIIENMADVNEVIVREFFEGCGFLIRTNRKFVAKGRREKRGIDFFVSNLHPLPSNEPTGFILDGESVKTINQAVGRIEPWHTDRFYRSVILRDERLFDLLSPESLEEAQEIFKNSDFKKILIISRLPANPKMLDESVKTFKEKGIDHILTFTTIIWEVMKNIKSNKNYYNNSLELLRILKQYRLFKKPQLELFKNRP